MQIINAKQVQQKLTFPTLVEALKQQLCRPYSMPRRRVYALSEATEDQDAFALLPAWDDESIAVKAFTYLPDNPVKNPGHESLYSQILLFDRQTGVPQALIDGTSVTYWRTAAISALATSFLARENSSRLLLCATGNLASYMALAHASVRPITAIRVWGRNPQKVAATISAIKAQRADIEVTAADALQVDVPWADIISCATGSPTPLFPGEWVSPGTHTDFVGNHHKDCRECDTYLVTTAQVYVDARLNVFNEAGELLIPVAEGLFSLDEVKAELAELCQEKAGGRLNDNDITLFKSVGSALADLAGARLVFKAMQEQ